MRNFLILGMVIGVTLGSLGTYLAVRISGECYASADTQGGGQTTTKDSPDKVELDPFEPPEPRPLGTVYDMTDEATLPSIDLSDPAERDLIISQWYWDMGQVVANLELQTGHKFTPVGKLYASPMEILEEQSNYLNEFLEETDRIAKNATDGKAKE